MEIRRYYDYLKNNADRMLREREALEPLLLMEAEKVIKVDNVFAYERAIAPYAEDATCLEIDITSKPEEAGKTARAIMHKYRTRLCHKKFDQWTGKMSYEIKPSSRLTLRVISDPVACQVVCEETIEHIPARTEKVKRFKLADPAKCKQAMEAMVPNEGGDDAVQS